MTNKINKCDGNHGGPRCADPGCWNDEHVPPAGGEVEVLARVCKGHVLGWGLTGYLSVEIGTELVDRAHVTRLQAEVSKWQSLAQSQNTLMEVMGRSGKRLTAWNSALQSELTKARNALLKIVHASEWTRDDAHYAAEAQTIAVNATSNQSAPADKHEAHCVLLDPEEPAAECTCKHRFMSLADDPRRCADCDAVEVLDDPADKGEECVHDFRMFSGECHKCGADWIPGKEYAPADKERFANGTFVGSATLVGSAGNPIWGWKFVESGTPGTPGRWEECPIKFAPADKRQGEPVACAHGIRAPHACDQCEAQNDVPDYWEDPDTGTCIDQWSKIQGLNGTEAYSIPLYRHAERPAPVAVILPKRIAADDLNEIAQGWNCCLDAVERLNP